MYLITETFKNKISEDFSNKLKNNFKETLFLDDVYTNAKTSIYIKGICGHRWKIIPSNLFSRGNGDTCPECFGQKCGKNNIWTKEEVNILVNNYTISLEHTYKKLPHRSVHSIYNKAKELDLEKPIIIPVSRILSLKQADENINRVFPYLHVLEYTAARNLCTIKSDLCGHTYQTKYGNLLQKLSGFICKECGPRAGTSIGEQELLAFIKENYNGWIIENDRKNLGGQELDIVLPDLGLAFEYNGVYWHSDKFKDKNYHIDKTNLLKENTGYQLIHISSDEWLTRQEIVKSRVLNLLGKSKKLFARKCTIKEISFPRDFLVENHIQGAGTPTKINLGLFLEDELVSVMTFSKPRFTDKYDFELVRFCSRINTTVIGGASKLFAYFNNNYLGSIISYSDKRWSNGNLYKKLGFQYSHTSDPNYRYYKGLTSLSRYQCQKHLLKALLLEEFDSSLTEYENMTNSGYIRTYDCGNDVWIFT